MLLLAQNMQTFMHVYVNALAETWASYNHTTLDPSLVCMEP